MFLKLKCTCARIITKEKVSVELVDHILSTCSGQFGSVTIGLFGIRKDIILEKLIDFTFGSETFM